MIFFLVIIFFFNLAAFAECYPGNPAMAQEMVNGYKSQCSASGFFENPSISFGGYENCLSGSCADNCITDYFEHFAVYCCQTLGKKVKPLNQIGLCESSRNGEFQLFPTFNVDPSLSSCTDEPSNPNECVSGYDDNPSSSGGGSSSSEGEEFNCDEADDIELCLCENFGQCVSSSSDGGGSGSSSSGGSSSGGGGGSSSSGDEGEVSSSSSNVVSSSSSSPPYCYVYYRLHYIDVRNGERDYSYYTYYSPVDPVADYKRRNPTSEFRFEGVSISDCRFYYFQLSFSNEDLNSYTTGDNPTVARLPSCLSEAEINAAINISPYTALGYPTGVLFNGSTFPGFYSIPHLVDADPNSNSYISHPIPYYNIIRNYCLTPSSNSNNSSSSSISDDDYCSQWPDSPLCHDDDNPRSSNSEPYHCDVHPEDPLCDIADVYQFCLDNPTDPFCVWSDYCSSHVSDPQCVNPQNPGGYPPPGGTGGGGGNSSGSSGGSGFYCTLFPTAPSCQGDGDGGGGSSGSSGGDDYYCMLFPFNCSDNGGDGGGGGGSSGSGGNGSSGSGVVPPGGGGFTPPPPPSDNFDDGGDDPLDSASRANCKDLKNCDWSTLKNQLIQLGVEKAVLDSLANLIAWLKYKHREDSLLTALRWLHDNDYQQKMMEVSETINGRIFLSQKVASDQLSALNRMEESDGLYYAASLENSSMTNRKLDTLRSKLETALGSGFDDVVAAIERLTGTLVSNGGGGSGGGGIVDMSATNNALNAMSNMQRNYLDSLKNNQASILGAIGNTNSAITGLANSQATGFENVVGAINSNGGGTNVDMSGVTGAITTTNNYLGSLQGIPGLIGTSNSALNQLYPIGANIGEGTTQLYNISNNTGNLLGTTQGISSQMGSLIGLTNNVSGQLEGVQGQLGAVNGQMGSLIGYTASGFGEGNSHLGTISSGVSSTNNLLARLDSSLSAGNSDLLGMLEDLGGTCTGNECGNYDGVGDGAFAGLDTANISGARWDSLFSAPGSRGLQDSANAFAGYIRSATVTPFTAGMTCPTADLSIDACGYFGSSCSISLCDEAFHVKGKHFFEWIGIFIEFIAWIIFLTRIV